MNLERDETDTWQYSNTNFKNTFVLFWISLFLLFTWKKRKAQFPQMVALMLMTRVSRELGLCRVLQRYQVTSPWPLVPWWAHFLQIDFPSQQPIRGEHCWGLTNQRPVTCIARLIDNYSDISQSEDTYHLSANQRTLITYQLSAGDYLGVPGGGKFLFSLIIGLRSQLTDEWHPDN